MGKIMTKHRAVISVIGHDQKGVVARISTYLAGCSINIEDIQQRVMEGLFIMTMLVDISDLNINLDELILGLKRIGEDIHMEVTIRLHGRKEPKRVAVLVSKEAHCLERLIRDRERGVLNGDLRVVLSNHDALQPLAAAHNIPYFWLPATDKAAHQAFLLEKLKENRAELVVLARYMQIVGPAVVEQYRDRIVNIHPSLLPYHPGANAYKQAYEEGVRVSGCTAHIVTEQLDQGPIILQDVFHIRVGEDTLEEVKARGKALEAAVLAQAVELFLNDQLVVRDRKVIFRPGYLAETA